MSERVLGDNVLVTERKEAGETQTAGGIILSGDLSTGNKPALVLAVGLPLNMENISLNSSYGIRHRSILIQFP